MSLPKKMKQKPKRNSFWHNQKEILAIAHRGGDAAGADKENTLLAFETAKNLGYNYGETDVILSKDGQVVAIHGAANALDGVVRRSQSRRWMQHKSLAQLREKYKIGGQEIPTLEQLLNSQPQMKFFIDPKTEEVVDPLYKLLHKLDIFERVCVGSFSLHRIERFKRLAAARSVHRTRPRPQDRNLGRHIQARQIRSRQEIPGHRIYLRRPARIVRSEVIRRL